MCLADAPLRTNRMRKSLILRLDRQKKLLICLTVVLSLTSCGMTTSFDGSACPPLKTYKKAKHMALAKELDGLPSKSVIPDFISDYHVLRNMVRECTTMKN